MTREQYDEFSAPLIRTMQDMEDEILHLIAAQLARDGDFSDTSKWRIRQLARSGELGKEAAELIASYSGVETGQAMEAIEAAALTEIGYVDGAVADLARQGLFDGAVQIPAESSAMNAVRAFKRQAKSDLNLVNTVMAYKAKSAYVNAVNNAYFESEKSRRRVLDTMGKYSASNVMGHMSLQESTRRCIAELSAKGIPAFVDKRGREWSPEAYVMMDMRSTLGNTARAAQWARCDEYGIKLVEISSHNGARPLCAKDQGKIYSRDGTSGVTTDGAGNKIPYTPLSETSYGKPDGILGINCGHVPYPFVAGCSFQSYFPYPEEENSERYKQFQKQRYYERQIRETKRECMMYNATGDTEAFEKASARLKKQRSDYKQYSNAKGLALHNDRTQVYGFDRSVSSKATWAGKRSEKNNFTAIDKPNKRDIINIGKCKDFDELSDYLSKKYGITLSDDIRKLNFETCLEPLKGFEIVCSEFPDLGKLVDKISTDSSGVMSCNGTRISFNPHYFSGKNSRDKFVSICKRQSDSGYWVKNASPISTGVHESAHGVEWLLIESNPNNSYGFQKTYSWDKCLEAKDIVSKAIKNIKKTPYGKGKKKDDLVKSISGYARVSDSETMAEAFADLYANGEQANPLSIEIKRLTVEKLNKYKGAK